VEANTGVGGVIRDVLGVRRSPLPVQMLLCFGPPDTDVEELPLASSRHAALPAAWWNGIRDYGNKMGIPTVNGAVLYDRGYLFNPSVSVAAWVCCHTGAIPATSNREIALSSSAAHRA